MTSRMKCFFIFLILCNPSSQLATDPQIDESVAPVSVTQFNNNLGTFIEYKAQVITKNGVLKFHNFYAYQALEKNIKSLQELCHGPDLAEYRNTIQNLDTVDLENTISDFVRTVYQYTVPSTWDQKFNLYQLTPIPKLHLNGTIEILDIESPYVGINDEQNIYFNLQNLDDCLKMNSNTLVCELNGILTISNAEVPCALAAIRNQTSTACTSHLVMRNAIWTPLLAPNSWMATVKKLTINVACFRDEPELKIHGTVVLTIRSGCRVFGTPLNIQGSQRKWTLSNRSYAYLQPTIEEKPENTLFPYITGAVVIILIFLCATYWYYHLHQGSRFSFTNRIMEQGL
ncbi:uncharacterized protein LOC119546886 [Drosophila subpulchrella]|uniref:uncharacterized protein LOC119546886 n=1 Tax=Drosophila subpulchrella TaxID=1486046 RepID=UPI0018A13B09|nr:uncharacterized protein LOC119546886 [Drosophila subpulchrella]